MHIVDVHVQTQQFNAQKTFYTQTLGLPLVSETCDEFVLQTGNSQLAWKGGIEEGTLYHIAFTIPRNKFPQAKKWIQGKIPLLTQNDNDEFISPSWNSHSLYFLDAAGHVLELIARHDLENDTQGDFGSADFLCMSEIGLVVSDVPTQVAMFQTLFGLGVYKNSVAENFAAVGDGHGLFILSQRGRPWQPTTTAKGIVSPVRVTIAGPEERCSDITQYPYTIHVVQERGEGKQ